MISMDLMDRIPAGDNPYSHDLFHMGKSVGSNITVMFASHDDQVCDYLILIDQRTGERVRVTFSGGEKAAEKGAVFNAMMGGK